MLRAILRKAVADMRGRLLQTTLLFLVIAAAAATLSVALNVQASAARPYDRLRQESNGADAWALTVPGTTDFSGLENSPGVAELGEPYPVYWGGAGIRNGERKQEVAVVGLPAELPAFDHPVVTDGRWLAPGGANEIVLDSGAADYLDLHVGDPIELLTSNGNVPFTIVGFAVTASRNPAPINDPAFVYVLPETLSALTPGAVYGTDEQHTLRVGLRFAPGTSVVTILEGTRGRPGAGLLIRTWEDVRQQGKEANQFDIIFLDVFALFALLASGLIIANGVGGQVLSQVHDIGILKAIGFTPRQVTATLLVQNLCVSLLASLAGVFVGLMVAPYFLKRSAAILGVPATASFDPVLLAITAIVVAVIVALFTLVPAWRAGRVAAIEALNASNNAGSGGVSRLAKLAAWLHLPRVAVVGVKDLSRRPMRTTMTVAALVIAVITATFSLGIESTFSKTMNDPTVIGGPPFDIATDRDTLSDGQARTILDANPDVALYLPAVHTDGAIPQRGVFAVWAYEGSLERPAWALREGHMPRVAGEAAISTTLARSLGLSVGEHVTVTLHNGPIGDNEPVETMDVDIVGKFVNADGESMSVLRETLPGDDPPTDYLIKTIPGADDHAVAGALIQASGGVLDPEVYSETIESFRHQWRPVLFGLNLVLFVIAGINLLSSQLLSIRERRRDFAILKTVGFSPAQIVAAVLSGSCVLALVAVGIGIPLGLVASRVMFDILSSAAGIGTGVGALPGVVWLAPLVPMVLVVTALASAVPARIASSLHVAEALRYE